MHVATISYLVNLCVFSLCGPHKCNELSGNTQFVCAHRHHCRCRRRRDVILIILISLQTTREIASEWNDVLIFILLLWNRSNKRREQTVRDTWAAIASIADHTAISPYVSFALLFKCSRLTEFIAWIAFERIHFISRVTMKNVRSCSCSRSGRTREKEKNVIFIPSALWSLWMIFNFQ